MLNIKRCILSKYKYIYVIITVLLYSIAFSGSAVALNAEEIMNKMNEDQRTGYIAGVVEGVAYSRWLRDKPNAAGMQCVYDWFYNGGIELQRSINTWFDRHPDKPAGPLLYVLIKKDCGE